MRFLNYVLLAAAVLLLHLHVASCDAVAAIASSEVIKTGPLATAGIAPQRRFLRNDAEADEAAVNNLENYEERGIVPASVKQSLKNLGKKDDTSTIYVDGIGTGMEQGAWGEIVRYYRRVKNNLDYFFRTAYWQFRFAIWVSNKRTPAKMYDKLKVRETTGPYDKNYRIYVNYLRFYENFKGPTHNPLFVFGPKFKTD